MVHDITEEKKAAVCFSLCINNFLNMILMVSGRIWASSCMPEIGVARQSFNESTPDLNCRGISICFCALKPFLEQRFRPEERGPRSQFLPVL